MGLLNIASLACHAFVFEAQYIDLPAHENSLSCTKIHLSFCLHHKFYPVFVLVLLYIENVVFKTVERPSDSFLIVTFKNVHWRC